MNFEFSSVDCIELFITGITFFATHVDIRHSGISPGTARINQYSINVYNPIGEFIK